MRKPRSAGFSLIELVISMGITLMVMAIVFQLSRQLEMIYRAEVGAVERTSGAIRALDELTGEIARAGYGLGDGVDSVVPCLAEDGPASDCIVLRSNPDGVAARIVGDLKESSLPVRVSDGGDFELGDTVLLVDRAGQMERAEVREASPASLRLKSLEGPEGSFLHSFSGTRDARILKLREVRFRIDDDQLVKEDGGRSVAVAGYIAGLSFDYVDEQGGSLALEKVGKGPTLAAVKVQLRLATDGVNPGGRPALPPALSTAVDLDQQSVSVDFDDRVPGLRLSRFFYPLVHPIAVASRPRAPTGVVVLSGENPYREPASLFTYWLQKSVTMADLERENVVALEDVRRPVAASFGPEDGPLAGSFFLAAWGLRRGHLALVQPDSYGVLSNQSRVTTFDGTELLAMVGGMTFGLDGNLYLTGEENGGIFRLRFDRSGRPRGGPEEVGRVEGSPGSMTLGADGALYFAVNRGKAGSLFKLPFDEKLEPGAPVEVSPLTGKALALAADPLSAFLYALVGDDRGDSTLLEISPEWIRDPKEPLPEVLRWSRWLSDRQQGKLPLLSPVLPDEAVPPKLDFLGFDHAGSIYVGSSEFSTVLRFDFNRPGIAERYAVGVCSVVEGGDAPRVRLHTWKKSVLPF